MIFNNNNRLVDFISFSKNNIQSKTNTSKNFSLDLCNHSSKLINQPSQQPRECAQNSLDKCRDRQEKRKKPSFKVILINYIYALLVKMTVVLVASTAMASPPPDQKALVPLPKNSVSDYNAVTPKFKLTSEASDDTLKSISNIFFSEFNQLPKSDCESVKTLPNPSMKKKVQVKIPTTLLSRVDSQNAASLQENINTLFDYLPVEKYLYLIAKVLLNDKDINEFALCSKEIIRDVMACKYRHECLLMYIQKGFPNITEVKKIEVFLSRQENQHQINCIVHMQRGRGTPTKEDESNFAAILNFLDYFPDDLLDKEKLLSCISNIWYRQGFPKINDIIVKLQKLYIKDDPQIRKVFTSQKKYADFGSILFSNTLGREQFISKPQYLPSASWQNHTDAQEIYQKTSEDMSCSEVSPKLTKQKKRTHQTEQEATVPTKQQKYNNDCDVTNLESTITLEEMTEIFQDCADLLTPEGKNVTNALLNILEDRKIKIESKFIDLIGEVKDDIFVKFFKNAAIFFQFLRPGSLSTKMLTDDLLKLEKENIRDFANLSEIKVMYLAEKVIR